MYWLKNFLINLRHPFDWLRLKFFLHRLPKKMFGISGWNMLNGEMPADRHGKYCECWSCRSQTVDPKF